MAWERREGYRLWIGGPVPPGADGITLGSLVVVRSRAAASPRLLLHEQVHVRQWKRHGVIGFLVRYVGAYALGRLRGRDHRGAYLHIPLEIEADWVARRSVATAVTDPVEPEVARS